MSAKVSFKHLCVYAQTDATLILNQGNISCDEHW